MPQPYYSKVRTEDFKIPIISNGVGEKAIYGFTNIPKITKPAVTVSARGTIGYAEYRNYPYYPIIRLLSVIPKDCECLNTKYLYYVLQKQHYDVPIVGIPQLTTPSIQKISVPVPPLPVQEEIVRILDRFDALVNDISVGLPAELSARRQQYEYYRNRLLTFERAR